MNTQKGRARLYVDRPAARSFDDQIPEMGCVAYSAMEIEALRERWKGFLLLPEQYVIIGVFFDIVCQQWVLIVESDTIPLPAQGEMIPILEGMYQVDIDPDNPEKRQVSLKELKLR